MNYLKRKAPTCVLPNNLACWMILAVLLKKLGKGEVDMSVLSNVMNLFTGDGTWVEFEEGSDSVVTKLYGVDKSYVEFRNGEDHVVVHNTQTKKGPLKIKLKDIVEVYFGPPLLRPGVWDMSMMWGYGYWNFLVMRNGDTKIVGFRIKEEYQVCVRQGAFGAPSKRHPYFKTFVDRILAAAEKAQSA